MAVVPNASRLRLAGAALLGAALLAVPAWGQAPGPDGLALSAAERDEVAASLEVGLTNRPIELERSGRTLLITRTHVTPSQVACRVFTLTEPDQEGVGCRGLGGRWDIVVSTPADGAAATVATAAPSTVAPEADTPPEPPVEAAALPPPTEPEPAATPPVAEPTPPEPDPAAAPERAVIVQVQQRLGALGFPAGAADGVIGRRTRQALAAFQAENGLAITGEPTPETLQLLGVALP